MGVWPERLGIASSAEGLTDLTGYTAVAVAAQRLIYAGQVRLLEEMSAEDVTAVRAAAETAGAAQLLYVAGTETALKGTAGTTASLLFWLRLPDRPPAETYLSALHSIDSAAAERLLAKLRK